MGPTRSTTSSQDAVTPLKRVQNSASADKPLSAMTLALRHKVPAACARRTTCTLLLAPGSSMPNSQATCLATTWPPSLPLTNVVLSGSVLVTRQLLTGLVTLLAV